MRRVRIGCSCLLLFLGSWVGAWDARGETGLGATPATPLVRWAPDADWPFTHFRAAQPRARVLIRRAWDRSQTIRDLLSRLESSDVIAFFALSPFLQLPTGRTSFMSMAGAHRCLNLALNERNSEDQLITLLGHELHHALELADVPEVRDVPGYERLYQRIGSSWSEGKFETREAVETAQQVRRDLGGDTPFA